VRDSEGSTGQAVCARVRNCERDASCESRQGPGKAAGVCYQVRDTEGSTGQAVCARVRNYERGVDCEKETRSWQFC